jgi:hypothetical protein
MKTFASLILCLLPMCGFGMDRLSALSMLETGNDDHAVGSDETARKVMTQLMDKRLHAFEEHFGRKPTDFEFYALWNAPAQAMSGHFSRAVAERCQRFANLCERDRKMAQLASAKTSR